MRSSAELSLVNIRNSRFFGFFDPCGAFHTTASIVGVSQIALLRFVKYPPDKMDDLWQDATRALQHKRFAEASILWTHILLHSRNALGQRQGNNWPIDFHNLGLSSVRVLSSGDIELIHNRSAHNQLEVFDGVFALQQAHGVVQDTFQALLSLYNLALSYHLEAFKVPPRNSPSRLLQKAKHMYCLCLDAACSTLQDGQQPIPVLLLLCLACYNNRGHIQSHFGDHEEVSHSVERILELLPYIYDRDTSRQLGGTDDADLEFFLRFGYSSFQHNLAAAACI